jgi:hypothetical protein
MKTLILDVASLDGSMLAFPRACKFSFSYQHKGKGQKFFHCQQ